MCQCVLCDCCWWNFCGVLCAGWHEALFCASCWILKPEQMSNPSCCSLCTWTGFGGNFFCYGALCCAPDYVKQFSRKKGGKENIGDALTSGKQGLIDGKK